MKLELCKIQFCCKPNGEEFEISVTKLGLSLCGRLERIEEGRGCEGSVEEREKNASFPSSFLRAPRSPLDSRAHSISLFPFHFAFLPRSLFEQLWGWGGGERRHGHFPFSRNFWCKRLKCKWRKDETEISRRKQAIFGGTPLFPLQPVGTEITFPFCCLLAPPLSHHVGFLSHQ